MKYIGEFYEEEQKDNSVIIYMALAMSLVILLITGIVFWQNKPRIANVVKGNKIITESNSNPLSAYISGSSLTSDQLDIWSIPKVPVNQTGKTDNGKNGTVVNNTTGEVIAQGIRTENDTNVNDALIDASEKTSVYGTTIEDDQVASEDDIEEIDRSNQLLLKLYDGTEEWVDINPEIAKNNYDNSKLIYQKPMMKYYLNGKKISKFGVDISGRLGDINFGTLKKAGCDYVTIRLGTRGYSSGKIVMDEKYKKNLENAKIAGLKLGASFTSQAVNEKEVLEEIDAILDAVEKYPIDYPILCCFEATQDDVARTDILDIENRTKIAEIFMGELEKAGYKPVLYGTKEWLMTKIDLETLSKYDVCLNQPGEVPDYPYHFSMWKYNTEGTINGISKPTSFTMSFVDYN